MDGKLAASATVEVDAFGALLFTETGNISEASVAEGAGDRAEGAGDKAEGGAGAKAEGAGAKADGAGGKFDIGKDEDVTLGVLVLKGSKDDGSSGKLEDTAGNERL